LALHSLQTQIFNLGKILAYFSYSSNLYFFLVHVHGVRSIGPEEEENEDFTTPETADCKGKKIISEDGSSDCEDEEIETNTDVVKIITLIIRIRPYRYE